MPRSPRHRRMLEAMGIRVFERTRDEVATTAPRVAPSTRSPRPLKADPVAAADVVVRTASAPPPEPVAVPLARSEAGAPIAGMDWDALQATVSTCRLCALCETRRQTVFGVGHRQAHWMIVGEAPGEQEDAQGEPFVGASGQLLDAMLHALDLSRHEGSAPRHVYIANTLKCRPPRNRNPTLDELRTCEPYLRRQIALIAPRVIVAMGRFAVQSLLRTDEAIGRLRGRVHTFEGTPLVVTYHPAYLLRNPIDKARAWEDLCLAAEQAERQDSTG